MFDVVGVGTNSVDEVVRIDKTAGDAISSGKCRITGRHLLAGGQTATVTAGCAALGLRSAYVGAFGSDARGATAKHALSSRGVDLTNAVHVDAPNRSALILVDSAGHRTVLWERDDRLNSALDAITPAALNAKIVHIDDDDPQLAITTARVARQAGTPVTSDIEHATDLTEELIAAVSYPIFDANLPKRLTGEDDPERALRKLRRLNSGVLVMTLGDRGVVALEGDRFETAPAFRIDAVDTTGAGDLFRAGFIYGVLRGWQLRQLLQFANATAAVSCTRLGAIPAVPTLAEVNQLVAGSL